MKRKSGFTLIELMVVMSVLGILMNIALNNSARVLKKSKDAALKLQLNALRNAVHQFLLDNNGRFPDELSLLAPDYINKAPTSWQAERFGGKLHYNPETGAISLYNESGEALSADKDASGVCYGSY